MNPVPAAAAKSINNAAADRTKLSLPEGHVHRVIANNLMTYLADAFLTLPQPIGFEQAVAGILEKFTQAGGATFHIYFGMIENQSLYAVSIYPERTRFLEGRQLPRAVVHSFWRENAELLQDARCCVGVWYDAEDDTTYLDVSVMLADEQQAIVLARQYNQRGIFSFERQEVITTGGTGQEVEGLFAIALRLPAFERMERSGTDASNNTSKDS